MTNDPLPAELQGKSFSEIARMRKTVIFEMQEPRFVQGVRAAVDQCLEHANGPCRMLRVEQSEADSTITVTVTIETDLKGYHIGDLITA